MSSIANPNIEPLQKKGLFLLLMILMSSVGLVASDICLPALPEMATYFECQQTDIQASITVFLFVLALSSLVYGRLSDRFGPKIILLFGYSLFTLASIFAARADTLTELIVFRGLQAMGSAVGSVLSRAIIADRFNKTETVKIFTTIYPIIGLSPAISPFIGGYLTHFFDWRANFYFLAGLGIVVFMLISLFLEDTSRDARAQRKKELSDYGYGDVIKNIFFLGYACILCMSYAVFRCYTSESPFVFDKQGFVAEEIGYFYITLSIAYLIGNLGAKKLVSFCSIEKALSIGFLFFVFGGVSLVLSAYFFAANPLAIIVPMSIITIGNGFLFPIGSAAAMSSVPIHFTGGASGLLGSLQLSIAALSVYYIGGVSAGRALPMSLYLLCMISLGFLSFLLMIYRAKRSALRE